MGNTLVDFAIRLPSVSGDTLLPVDSKFPVEEYERLCESSEKGDWAGTELARKNLERAVRVQAESIAKNTSCPRDDGLCRPLSPFRSAVCGSFENGRACRLLHKRRIILSGPSNFAALLSLLQTGFRTAAIEKRSGELVRALEQFRMEFARFAEGLDKAKRKLQEAQDSVENAAKRTDVIGRQLDRFQISDGNQTHVNDQGGQA